MAIKKLKQSFIFSISFCFFVLAISCKSKQTDVPKANDTDIKQTSNSVSATGKVSHQFKSTGCETIIVCEKEKDTLYLIPMTSLEKFDVDKLEISFNYRILRVHNPKGCKQGIPAQISNIKEKAH